MCETMYWLGGVTMTNRVMIVYERVGNSKTTLRIDNGNQFIVTKIGDDAAAARSEHTEEPKTSLEKTLRNLADRGFTRAVVGRREMRAVKTDGVELSLRDVRRFDDPHDLVSTLFEVEALDVAPGEEVSALDRVERRMRSLRLTQLTDDEFNAWVTKTHAAADRPFEYTPEAATELAASINVFANR